MVAVNEMVIDSVKRLTIMDTVCCLDYLYAICIVNDNKFNDVLVRVFSLMPWYDCGYVKDS